MQGKESAAVGVIGGALDVIVGFLWLQQSMSQRPAGMMTQGVGWLGYFLIALGILVLSSGVFMFVVPMIGKRPMFGWLMAVYGVTMLLLGVEMINGVIAMMEGAALSGALMLLVGVAMLISAFRMLKR